MVEPRKRAIAKLCRRLVGADEVEAVRRCPCSNLHLCNLTSVERDICRFRPEVVEARSKVAIAASEKYDLKKFIENAGLE